MVRSVEAGCGKAGRPSRGVASRVSAWQARRCKSWSARRGQVRSGAAGHARCGKAGLASLRLDGPWQARVSCEVIAKFNRRGF